MASLVTTTVAGDLTVTKPNSGGVTVQQVQKWTQTSQNTLLLNMYGGSTDLVQLAATNAEQNISIVTEASASLSATTTKGIYIKSGGSVGIGTIGPDSKLEIAGGGYNSSLKIKGGGSHTGIQFEDSGGTTDGYIYAENGSIGLLDSGASWMIQCKDDDYIRFATNGNTEHMRITSSGSVGIGTTNPGYKLEVKASVTGNWLSRIYNTATSGNSSGLLVRMDEPGSTGIAFGVYANGGYKFRVEPDGETQILSGSAYTTHLNYQNSGNHYISMGNSGFTNFRGGSNGITTMSVKGDGKVGIKDTSPQTALAVNGEASFGDGSRLSLIGLSIASSASSPDIKIRTKIPFALSGADFTVNIKGFIYGLTETANLTVCWHYYNSTFYNATCSSAGSWAPTIQLSAFRS